MRKFSILVLTVVIITVIGSVFFALGPEKAAIVLEDDRTFEPEDRTTEDRTKQGIVQAVLEVQDLSYEVFVPEGSTAYDVMTAAASQYQDFSFQGREFGGIGFFVEEINGLVQDQKKGMYWIYYINGKTAQVGVSQYKLKNNDIITWKYEKEH